MAKTAELSHLPLCRRDWVVDNLERIKSGRLKKGISLRDPREGEGCPMWEEWQVAP